MQESLILHGAAVVVACTAAVTDWRSGTIPNWLTLPPLLLGPLVWGLLAGFGGFLDSLLGIFVCGLVPLVMWFVKIGSAPVPQHEQEDDEDEDKERETDEEEVEEVEEDEEDEEDEDEENEDETPQRDQAAVAMHGGDVKLFAAVGALAGWSVGLRAELLTFILAAVFAMAALAWRGRLFATLANALFLAINPLLPKRRRRKLSPENMSTIRMGVAAAAGTIASTLMAHPALLFF